METEKNWKLALGVVVAVAVVLVIFLISGRSNRDDDPSPQSAPLPTSVSSPTTTPMDKLIQEEILPTAAPSSTTTSAAPPGCIGTGCHGGEQTPVGEWKDTVVAFADAYGTLGNNTKEQWLDGIRPYTSPGLMGRLDRVDYDRMKPGGKPEIRMVDSSDSHTVVARINYPEGWSIYVQLTNRGTAFGGWQVDTIDTPREG